MPRPADETDPVKMVEKLRERARERNAGQPNPGPEDAPAPIIPKYIKDAAEAHQKALTKNGNLE